MTQPFYDTRHALENGGLIIRRNGTLNGITVSFPALGWRTIGKNVFDTPEAAIAAVNAERDAEIARLQKQIERLQRIEGYAE